MEKEDLKTFRRITAKRNFGHPIYLHDILEFILIVGKYKTKGVKHQPLGLCKAVQYALYKLIPHTPFTVSVGNWLIFELKLLYIEKTGFHPNNDIYWWEPGNWYMRTRFIKSVIEVTENFIVYDGKGNYIFPRHFRIKKVK